MQESEHFTVRTIRGPKATETGASGIEAPMAGASMSLPFPEQIWRDIDIPLAGVFCHGDCEPEDSIEKPQGMCTPAGVFRPVIFI